MLVLLILFILTLFVVRRNMYYDVVQKTKNCYEQNL